MRGVWKRSIHFVLALVCSGSLVFGEAAVAFASDHGNPIPSAQSMENVLTEGQALETSQEIIDKGDCGASGENLTWTLDAAGLLTISGEGQMADYKNYSQYAPWYPYREQIREVLIEDGVTTIGAAAFYNLPEISEIYIPKNVETIGNSAFAISGIERIEVAPENPYLKSEDGVLFSKDGTQLLHYPYKKADTAYVIPQGVEVITSSAFAHNDYVTEITVPPSVTEIQAYAFSSNRYLSELHLSEGLVSIGESAFDSCARLTQLSLPASVQRIGADAFWLSGLSEIQVHPDNIFFSSQDGVLFNSDGTALLCYPPTKEGTTWSVPEGVKRIAEHAISNCDNIQELVLPEGVTQVDAFGISFNDNLKGITIPRSLQYVQGNGFYGNDALQYIMFAGTQEEWQSLSVSGKLEGLPVHYNGTGHVEVVDEAVPATNATTGLTEGSHCAVCNTVLKAQQETGIRVYLENQVISDTTLDGDVYIGPNAVVTLNRVTIEGNLYVLGGARLNSITVNAIHARSFSFGYGSTFYNGTVYLMGSNSIGSMYAATYPVEEIPLYLEEGSLLADQGKVTIVGATPNIARFYCNGKEIPLGDDGWFTLEGMDVTKDREIEFQWVTVFGNTITKVFTVDACKEDGHMIVVDEKIEATCKTPGLTEGSHCTFCQEVLREQQTIPALGHNYVDDICTNCGIDRSKCKHTGGEATCIEKAICELCDTEYGEVDGNNHKHTQLEGEVPPTCTEAGCTAAETCTDCGATVQESTAIPPLGHSGEICNEIAATDDRDGYTGDLVCSRCDEVLEKGQYYVRIYRVYNPGNGKHHYTTDPAERDFLAENGWIYEGIAWNAPKEGDPIYRVYNPGNDNHLYTMDIKERDNLVKGGWNYEGILCYSAGSDGVPLYRVFNPYVTLNPHHYTDSLEECAFLESNGWKVEGISWYGLE